MQDKAYRIEYIRTNVEGPQYRMVIYESGKTEDEATSRILNYMKERGDEISILDVTKTDDSWENFVRGLVFF